MIVPYDMVSAVKLMGMSMLGIFLVMAIIALIVYLFTKFSK